MVLGVVVASRRVSNVLEGEIDRSIRVFVRKSERLPCRVAKNTINGQNIVVRKNGRIL